MNKRINAIITTLSPTVVGGETNGNIQMPYFLHKTASYEGKIKKSVFLEYIKTLRSFRIGCDPSKFKKASKQSQLDFFKERILTASCSLTLSDFFSKLKTYMDSEKPLPAYVTKFMMGCSGEQQANILQYTNENADLIVSIVDNVQYNNDPSKLFESKQEFMSLLENIDEELLKVSPIAKIPVLTGNGIRGIMRDLLMGYVIEKVYGENAQKVLKADAYNILFSGGLLMQSGGYESIEYKQKIRENMPFLSIFGTALIREMLQGKMKVDFAMLQCKETGKNNNYAISYLKEYFSTRKDDYEGEITEEVKDRSTVQMIYSKMFIQKGCMFDWGISYEHCNEIEESFIHLTLFLLQKHGTIGAMSRAGYGKVDIKYDQELDYQKAIDFIEQKKEDIKEWIHKITK